MQKFHGIYLGIVVQNNDPEKRGRVKVYIPQVSASVYAKWDKTNTDKKFKFPGTNIKSSLSDIIRDLKDILPWAECAAPIAGASSSGKYNAFNDLATVSDSNVKDQQMPSSAPSIFAKYKSNPEGIGEKPAKKLQALNTTDAFTDTSNGGSKINPYGLNYSPSSYSNAAKGSFSIPSVGSQVWCFFENSSHLFPVYFAVAHGADDFAGIYDNGLDYPGANENKDSRDILPSDPNLNTYRNKYVISQKGGSLEFVNTDNREAVKINHFSGSFVEFNNFTSSRLAANNDQLVVKKDQFKTIFGNSSSYVGFDKESIIKGDNIKKIGSLNATAFTNWLSAIAPVNAARSSSSASPTTIASAVTSASTALLTAEQQMGDGGNDMTYITKHQIEVVGPIINNLQSLKITAAGNTLDAIMGPSVSVVQQPFDKIERVHVDDMPGGTKTTTIGNRWNVTIGAGGFNLKTYGPIDISGTSVALTGDQTVIAASNQLNIDSKNYMAIASKILVLKAKNNGQVLIAKSGMGIERNMMIAGGAHVQGNMSVGKLIGPKATHVTYPTIIGGGLPMQIENIVVTGSNAIPNGGQFTTASKITCTVTFMPPHSHLYDVVSQEYFTPISDNAAKCADNSSAVPASAPYIATPVPYNGPLPAPQPFGPV